jgi:hypothetical protein
LQTQVPGARTEGSAFRAISFQAIPLEHICRSCAPNWRVAP